MILISCSARLFKNGTEKSHEDEYFVAGCLQSTCEVARLGVLGPSLLSRNRDWQGIDRESLNNDRFVASYESCGLRALDLRGFRPSRYR